VLKKTSANYKIVPVGEYKSLSTAKRHKTERDDIINNNEFISTPTILNYKMFDFF